MSLVTKTLDEKPIIQLVTLGHVDHGKSTIMGHLLSLVGEVSEKEVKKLEESTAKSGMEHGKYAWVLQRREYERKFDGTIELSRMKLETSHRIISLLDAPGHRDFVKNMITGASQADASLLVVSAKSGEGVQQQTIEHLWLFKILGIKQLVVAINKMDACAWSKKRYEEVKDECVKRLQKIGYNVEKTLFVPTSGWTGDNLVAESKNMPWYKGPTLYNVLDSLQPPDRVFYEKLPLRLPIQDVYEIRGMKGPVPIGIVQTGILKEGDTIRIEPIGKQGEVYSIEIYHKRVKEAHPGDGIGFNVRGISGRDIARGDVACHPDKPATVVRPSGHFVAQVIITQYPSEIVQGFTPIIHAQTAQVPCRIVELQKKLDSKTFQPIEDNPKFIKQGDAALVKIVPLKSVVIEKYSEIPPLGRFAIRHSEGTIGAGIVIEVIPKPS